MSKRSQNEQDHRSKAAGRALAFAVVAAPAMVAAAPVTARAQSLADLTAAPIETSYKQAFDILKGQNKNGPYVLTWNNLRASVGDPPISVNVDGKNLTSADFTIDAIKGTITFTNPLKDTSLARIDYAYDPLFSQLNANPAATAAPVTLPVTQLDNNTSLHVTALQSAPGKSGNAAQLVWGMDQKTRMLGGGLTSQLYFGDSANGKSGVMDRTGMKLAYGLGNAKNGLDAQFLRVGDGFAPANGKAFGMADPKQDLALSSRMTPMNWMGAAYTFDQTHNLNGTGGSEQNGLNLHLGGVRATDPTLNLQFADKSQSNGAGQNVNTNSNQADLSAKLAPTMALTAKTLLKQTDATDTSQDATVQETDIGLDSKNAKGNLTQASVALTDAVQKTVGAVQTHQAVTIKLQPAQKITFTLVQDDQATNPSNPAAPAVAKSTQTQTTVGAVLTPAPNTKVTGSLQQCAVNDVRTQVTNVNAQFSLSKEVAVDSGIIGRDSSQGGVAALTTTHVNLSLKTAPGVSVSTGMVMNPVDNGGNISQAQQQQVGLTLKQGAWEVGSGYSITTLVGAAASDSRGLASQTGEMSLNVGLRVSPAERVTWGYKNDFLYGNTNPAVVIGPRGLQAYTMNYTHTVGQALDLTLGGTMTDNRANTVDTQDLKATAKLAMKF